MKLKMILSLGCCALLLAGCGKNQKKAAPEKKVSTASAAVSNSDLAKGFLDALVPVTVSSISPEQKNAQEFAAAMNVVEALTQLESMTGLKFYGRSASLDQLAPELKAVLTAKNSRMIPFCVEEARTGRIVFAPVDAQQQIIRAWRKAFPRIAKRLDAAALQESVPAAAPSAPAPEKTESSVPQKTQPAGEPTAGDPAQDIMF